MKFSRRDFLKTSAVAVASAGLMAGCGKSESGSSTAAPQATATPVPTPSPTPEPPYIADVLTGEQREEDAKNSRVIGIMINNISNTSFQNARPQRGLSSAKMIFEIKVEGGITRFCALFDDIDDIPEIGPIRSGRDQFLQLLIPWQALYYHDGESVFCTRFINDWEYWDYNIGGKTWFDTPTHPLVSHRDKRGRDVATEHTEFTSGEEIQKAVDNAGIDMEREYKSTFFIFADYRYDEYNALDDGEPATSVTLRHSSSYRTYFDFDADQKKYIMSQYSAATKKVTETHDELNDEALAFTNLVVLFTTIQAYPGDSHDIQDVDYDNGGVGWFFTNGKAKMIRWTKGSPNTGLRLYEYEGDEEDSIIVNRGKTYLTVIDLSEFENFKYSGNENTATSDDLSDAGSVSDVTDDADSAETSEDAAAGISTD
jgi:hypothetical protein